ncbi:hypothetical protein HZH68_009615 [Vespula germanica]|uniref:Uncharacterized protein n=1 Tax=Vespula germanica TaxID=30212 RepID=A0A834N3M8_VESGE|nr:hypothetical protein HZH68_009615 [Vespula germanica]
MKPHHEKGEKKEKSRDCDDTADCSFITVRPQRRDAKDRFPVCDGEKRMVRVVNPEEDDEAVEKFRGLRSSKRDSCSFEEEEKNKKTKMVMVKEEVEVVEEEEDEEEEEEEEEESCNLDVEEQTRFYSRRNLVKSFPINWILFCL